MALSKRRLALPGEAGRRRALCLLRNAPNGATATIMLARGFTISLLELATERTRCGIIGADARPNWR
jgi:hypothetical protein